MKKKISSLFFSLILFSSIFYFISSVTATAHEDLKINHKKHKPIYCKLVEDRTWWEKRSCKYKTQTHRMCKIDQHCAILELERLQKIIDDLEDKIIKQEPIACNSLNFSHVALKDGNIYNKTSGTSKVIKKITKGQKISFIGETDKKGWLIIVPKDEICTVGYINESYIGQTNQGASDPPPKTNYTINITYPKWKKKRELIVLNRSGWFEIDGFIDKDLGINKVTLNYEGDDEEMIIGSNGSFNASLLIDDDLDVRIVAYKNDKQVGKTLKFKIQVGN